MSSMNEYDDDASYDFHHENPLELAHRREVRRLLEDKLERKRLREEVLDDWDDAEDEFEWEELLK